jgi:hypothetical protein
MDNRQPFARATPNGEAPCSLARFPTRAQHRMGEHKLADRRVRITCDVPSAPLDVGWDY